jgi:hypothetical protein
MRGQVLSGFLQIKQARSASGGFWRWNRRRGFFKSLLQRHKRHVSCCETLLYALGGRFTLEIAASRYGLLATHFQCAGPRLNPMTTAVASLRPKHLDAVPSRARLSGTEKSYQVLTVLSTGIFMYTAWLLAARNARVNLGLIKTVKNGVSLSESLVG